jgi:hypothetical protein
MRLSRLDDGKWIASGDWLDPGDICAMRKDFATIVVKSKPNVQYIVEDQYGGLHIDSAAWSRDPTFEIYALRTHGDDLLRIGWHYEGGSVRLSGGNGICSHGLPRIRRQSKFRSMYPRPWL